LLAAGEINLARSRFDDSLTNRNAVVRKKSEESNRSAASGGHQRAKPRDKSVALCHIGERLAYFPIETPAQKMQDTVSSRSI